ncbi:MAG TPA: tripartite tricarboxylate transporter substrate binding protein [Stellaceae bacterium]|nr:tripartite tricarboxylate transporter substrate binding protein [Stellaceae bacterium]
MKCRWRLLLTILAMLGMAAGHPASAADFPDQPVKIMVGFAPGGTVDLIARIIANQLQVIWKQPVVVENRAGASGFVGANIVARAKPDGYLVVLANPTSHILGPQATPAPYDALKDITLISDIMRVPNVLVVGQSVKARTMKELAAAAKAAPGTMSFASGGTGSLQQLAGVSFSQRIGGKLVHVPYNGSAAALSDLISGRVTMAFEPSGAMIPYITSGKLRALALTASQRLPQLPNVPTAKEAGFDNFEFYTWYGIGGPPGMPKDIVAKWHDGIVAAMKVPDVRKQIALLGGEPIGDTPAHFTAMYQADYRNTGKLMKEAGIAMEK